MDLPDRMALRKLVLRQSPRFGDVRNLAAIFNANGLIFLLFIGIQAMQNRRARGR